MGRARTKSKKARLVDVEPNTAESQEPPSIPSLLIKAQTLVTQCDYDLAQLFVRRILERSPHHAEAKELLGVIQLEKGDVADAQHVGHFLPFTLAEFRFDRRRRRSSHSSPRDLTHPTHLHLLRTCI